MGFSKKDIFGAGFLVLSVIFTLSVFSYDSNQLSSNYIGLLGHYTANVFLQLFGVSTFIIPLILFFTALFIFYKSKKHKFSYWRGLNLFFTLVSFSIFLSATFGPINYAGASFASGGIIGNGISNLLIPYISSTGTALIFAVLTIVLMFYVGDFSFSRGLTNFAIILYKALVIPSIYLYKGLSWFILWLASKANKEQEEVEQELPIKKLQSKIKRKVIQPEPDDEVEDEEIFVEHTKSTDKNYKLPSVELLNKVPRTRTKEDVSELEAVAAALQARLRDFDVDGEVVEVSPGPVITMYEFKPAPGVKINKVANLSDDLALALGCGSLRVIAPIPGKSVIGIEVPNKHRETVYARELIDSSLFKSSDKKIPIAVGKDTVGNPYVTDLANMPHLLVAGSTGSGKSVFVNSLICSILYKFSPQQVRLLMVDPKMLELSVYDGIPHLLHPVITDAQKASRALRWTVKTMIDRYALLSEKGAKSIGSYNATAEEPMPYIVVIVDELADLMMVSSKDVESSLTRLAQMARAAGIHLVLATQRPSVDVITGLIKANFPARISFKVASRVDSRTVLDGMGAEKLLGMGDMLFIPPGTARLERLHGAFVSDDEVVKIVDFVKKQQAPKYQIESLEEEEINLDAVDEDADELYDEAVRIVVETRKPTISYIQRRLKIGYNRAARIIELMEKNGVVSSQLSGGQREVLIDQR